MAIGARNPYLISSPPRSAGSILSSKLSSTAMAFLGPWKPARRKSRHRIAAENNNSLASSSSSSSQGFRINGGSSTDSENALSSWWQEAFARIDSSGGTSLLQMLHEGARAFQVSVERNESLSKGSWLVKKWTGFGFDTKAWMKLLSYQVSVYSLLQAAMEIAMRGDGRDRDVHIFVQRSLSHQCAPLEESIKKLLSSRDPSADWLWQQQLPFMVASYVNILEKDPHFSAVTSTTACPCEASDVALLRLTITACGAAMKLGPATVSCAAFTSTLTDEIGRLMNMQTEFVSITEVYSFSCNLGLRREFLSYFGSRAASGPLGGADERAFWVDLSEQFLRNALTREGVLTKLRPYDTAEALERDLATFGFFAALGRRARAFLSRKPESQLDEPIASLLRYLEGGCVLFYPQLSTLTYYQLFVEVVCEELEWLPLLPEASLLGNSGASDTVAIYTVLNVCSRWVPDFLKYSTWVQDPSGSRVVDFLIKCQSRLIECRERYNISLDSSRECVVEEDRGLLTASGVVTAQKQLQLLDEDLRNMEESICKLESLLQSSQSGSRADKLEALGKDLERLRRLKKEAEALEASFKAKTDVGGCLDDGSIAPELSENAKTYNDVFNKSIEKLREASSDLWRGTQLLSTDVASATILLKNGALGQQLTEREKKMLMRTFTDLASVIPIGFLMLLPVTAVGHAAMLAAIQKYVPALIPSAYAPERLDLLRQLERVKQLEAQSQQQADKREKSDSTD
ncbi:uncharacterized protein LOC9648011 [Selaginella moellendorffii]|uniref:uncharacterized protein LOC9648011 n=1 Tax=Selaginella moellendorffii TaxID=88036 RepID=UPI000D1CAD46|nr:uncharacterized protein LOC9648011 [Selaginella moellendorffii]|eukprot:XP_024519800.1 uncharacterized protein LOC9648011 [Selaginella moellendorffii]